jgi:hypothetical protein
VAFIYGNPIREYVGIDCGFYDSTSLFKSQQNLDYLSHVQPLKITLLNKDTQKLSDLSFLELKAFDLVHVDADHSFEGAITDMKNFWNVLDLGGHMLIDDSIFYGAVRSACIKFASLIEEPFYEVKTFRGTWVFLKTKRKTFSLSKSAVNEKSVIEPIQDSLILRRFSARHAGWSGLLVLLKDGFFKGGLNSPDGRWNLNGEILTLSWHHWPETKLKLNGPGLYISISQSDNLILHELDNKNK